MKHGSIQPFSFNFEAQQNELPAGSVQRNVIQGEGRAWFVHRCQSVAKRQKLKR
jgi:hypothetical protein